jgi:hypothetical protein
LQIGARLGNTLVLAHNVQYDGLLSIAHSAQVIAQGVQLFVAVIQVLPEGQSMQNGALSVLFATAEQEIQLTAVF